MSNRFTKLSSALWRSRRFRSLPNDAKLLYLYFASCEHQTSIGSYRVPDGYVLDDMGEGWNVKALKAARDQLVKADLIAWNDETSTVYVLRWFKHSPPMNDSHAKACIRLIGELEADAIRERVEADFTEANSQRNPIPAPSSNLAHLINGNREPSRFPIQRRG